MKHTPGPWKLIDIPAASSAGIIPTKRPSGVAARDVEDICSIDKTSDYDWKGNALLIAAAPDLLAAAEKVLVDLNNRIDAAREAGIPLPVFDGIAELYTAVNRARGRLDRLQKKQAGTSAEGGAQ